MLPFDQHFLPDSPPCINPQVARVHACVCCVQAGGVGGPVGCACAPAPPPWAASPPQPAGTHRPRPTCCPHRPRPQRGVQAATPLSLLRGAGVLSCRVRVCVVRGGWRMGGIAWRPVAGVTLSRGEGGHCPAPVRIVEGQTKAILLQAARAVEEGGTISK